MTGIILKADNFDTSDMELSYLSVALSATGTTLTVDNNNNFVASDYIIIGEEGNETAEIAQVGSVSGNTSIVISSGCKFAHTTKEPIRLLPFNQVKFYSSSSESGTYTAIINGAVEMEVDNRNRETVFNHVTGTTSTWYKFTYYNSTSLTETSTDDSTAVQGSAVAYCSIKDVMRLLQMNESDEDSPSQSLVYNLIEARGAQFDKETNSTYVTRNIGSSSDYQYIDGRGTWKTQYFLNYVPIVTITAMQTTQTDAGSTATWDTLTEGRDNHYLLYKDIGMVNFIFSTYVPPNKPASIRWYGTWGRSSVPDDVKITIAKGVVIDLATATSYRNIMNGRDFNPDLIEIFINDWDRTVNRYRIDRFIIP